MENSQSFSHPYSESFEQNQRLQEYDEDEQKAEPTPNLLLKENQKISDKNFDNSDFVLKVPLQAKQTQQTSSPITHKNSVNISNTNNRFLLPKRPRQSIGSQNMDRRQLLHKFSVNSQATKRPQQNQKLPNLGQASSRNEQNGFKRSIATKQRRSLHIVMSDKKIEEGKDPKEYIFVKNKRKSITNHVNSARRYADEEGGTRKNENKEINLGGNTSSQQERSQMLRKMRQKIHLMANKLIKQPKAKSLNKSINQITMKDQVIYKDPQRNSQRTVVFIKTYILSPFQSISLQISVLNGSIIIVGKLLGHQMDTLKLVLNQERSEKLLVESFDDWEIVGRRIFVQANEPGVKQLRIAPIKSVLSSIIKQQQSSQLAQNPSIQMSSNKTKQKNILFVKQTQFIQRNYYSQMNKYDSTLNTKQHSVPNSINPSSLNTINQNQNNSVPTTLKKQQKSPSIDVKQHLARQNKHLNYLSPQIRQKAKQFKKQKQQSLTKETIQKQLLQRQNLIKKQQQQIQRLSKPKQTIKSKSKQHPNAKNKVNNAKSISKQKIINFRTANRKSSQKQAQIRQSISIKDAQSRIDIKISNTQQTQKSKHNRNQQIQDLEPYSNKPYLASTNRREDPPQWKQIDMKRTDSIDHIRIQKESQEEMYSEFYQDDEKGVEKVDIRTKQRENNKSKKFTKGQKKQPSENDYGEDEFQSQALATQHKPTQNIQQKSGISQENRPQKVLEATALLTSSKEQFLRPKQKPVQQFEEQDYQELIRDIEEDEYENSFEKFKEEKPIEKSQKVNEMNKNIKTRKKQQIYQDKLQDSDYEEEISNGIKEEEIYQNKQQQNYEQEQNYEQDQNYENIIQENDMLDDDQVINKIEEDYADDEFDL